MKGSFYIIENNNKIKCDILHVFNYNNDNFIIYNDGSVDEDGFLNVFSSKFTINNSEITLLDTSDEEKNIIDKVWSDING